MRSITRNLVARELLLALLVLALSFLNFGHSTIAFAAGGRIVVSTSSVCGNPLIPADGDHVSCHACRIGAAADLPVPPVLALPVRFNVAPVAYAVPSLVPDTLPQRRVANPRAPPLV